MSYSRWGEDGSDVYVYLRAGDIFVCCSCGLCERPFSPEFDEPAKMIRHLEQHVAAGDTVPKRAFDKLLKDTEVPPPWDREPK